jgi:Fe-S-cluster-containing dehydrogenase component
VKKWALLVDVGKCTNCHNCTLATKDEHVGNEFPGYDAAQPAGGADWISIDRHIRSAGGIADVTYVPKMCNHCEEAPCVRAAGDGAIYRREDGIVMIDPVKARGRHELVASCPYGAIHWNDEAGLPQKWNFDAHLLDEGWDSPRCAQACPTGALEAVCVSDEELERRRMEAGLECLAPELGTRPRVLYRGLERISQRFLAGNVVRSGAGGRLENVVAAQVLLSIDAREMPGATDDFGDFKIDHLSNHGPMSYRLKVSHAEFGDAAVEGVLEDNMHLGSIRLPR